jgi:putative ABC transport system permease protein
VREVWNDAWFGARLLVLAAVTVALGSWYGTGLRPFPVWAIVRAAVQLSIVVLLLRGVLAAPWTAAAFILLMLSTASITATGRTREVWRGREAAVVGVAAGALVSLGAIFALQLADLEARYVVATGGIIIGNAMSAATLSGRNFLRSARARASEVEAWLSLGAPPTVAHRDIGREAARESLIPTLDQSKSTGLVTLPGAFVGALFGGASPADAQSSSSWCWPASRRQ